MASLLAEIPGAEALQDVLLGRKDIAAGGQVGHGMGNKVYVQQAGASWAKKIGGDASGGVGQYGTELGERDGLAGKAACRAPLADNVTQSAWGRQHRFEGAERILPPSALPVLCRKGAAPGNDLLRCGQCGGGMQARHLRIVELLHG